MSFEDYKEAALSKEALRKKHDEAFRKYNQLRKQTDVSVKLTIAEVEDLLKEIIPMGTEEGKYPFEKVALRLKKAIEIKPKQLQDKTKGDEKNE